MIFSCDSFRWTKYNQDRLHTLQLLRILVKFSPELIKNRLLVESLTLLWQKGILGEMNATNQKELKIIAKILLCHIHVAQDDVETIFLLLSAFETKKWPNLLFLRDFYQRTVPDTFSTDRKRSIITHLPTVFTSARYSDDFRGLILQILVIPMLEKSVGTDQDILEPEVKLFRRIRSYTNT